MRPSRNTPLVLGPKTPNNRKFGRVRCERLVCQFVKFDALDAQVLDISASGLRVCARRNTGLQGGDVVRVVLCTPDDRIETDARVIWCKHRGFRRHELGMMFADPTPELRQQLLAVMRSALDPHIIYDGHGE